MGKIEKQLQDSIQEWLGLMRVFHWRNNTGALVKDKHFIRFGFKGSPDIICVVGGQFVGIEVKTPKGRQNDNQIEFQRNLEEAGGTYLLVRDLDSVIEYFNNNLCVK